ncbi:MAG: hypothetical protein QJR01_04490 [Kyrpidia sp.]|nr:hypothetical protein [Kyrpidia sp.]
MMCSLRAVRLWPARQWDCPRVGRRVLFLVAAVVLVMTLAARFLE